MGQVTSGIRFRGQNARMTVGEIVDGFNSLTDAVIASGMLPVSAEDFPDQAGRFVTTPPGESETQIVLPPGTSSVYQMGINLFEHPSSDGYFLVEYLLAAYQTSASFISFSFRFVASLEDGSIPEIGSTPRLHFARAYPNGTTFLNILSTDPYRIRVSCSESHFWIYSESAINTVSSGNYRDLPRGLSPIAFGMFKPINALIKDWVILSVIDISAGAALGSSVYGPPVNQNEPASYRCYVCENGLVTQRPNGAAGYLIDPAKAALSGVRVQPAGMYLNGIFSTFQFGHAHMAIGEDCGIVFLDLDGTGDKQYIAAPAFGTSTPTFNGATANDLSMPILPWFD